jgi:hypothetical protein
MDGLTMRVGPIDKSLAPGCLSRIDAWLLAPGNHRPEFGELLCERRNEIEWTGQEAKRSQGL